MTREIGNQPARQTTGIGERENWLRFEFSEFIEHPIEFTCRIGLRIVALNMLRNYLGPRLPRFCLKERMFNPHSPGRNRPAPVDHANERAAGLQHTVNFRNNTFGAAAVMDYTLGIDHVEKPIFKGKIFGIQTS